MTSRDQGLFFPTTREAEERDPGNEVGTICLQATSNVSCDDMVMCPNLDFV